MGGLGGSRGMSGWDNLERNKFLSRLNLVSIETLEEEKQDDVEHVLSTEDSEVYGKK